MTSIQFCLNSSAKILRRLPKRLRGKARDFPLFVFVARVRKRARSRITSTIEVFQPTAALNILRLHNTLRVLWRVAKTFGRVTYSQHSLYLTDNTNLLAAVIHSFGNWHDGCSVRLPHSL